MSESSEEISNLRTMLLLSFYLFSWNKQIKIILGNAFVSLSNMLVGLLDDYKLINNYLTGVLVTLLMMCLTCFISHKQDYTFINKLSC